ncbi:DUF1795 domain-containing protein [Acidovorax sp. GBBC 3334]|uniref:DUF1795 domain-containing protein n=1 Tax=unclassified Acidovorax TaxID=2684926 RepID=UPI00230268F4|nr:MULTISPECIES: DUF1795 domain-containing protein [unclassified Acidovorax]MDA8453477.1 DUF1795 domain-containing protein [Acidovorax sp. GBBC 3334]MDA8521083.1 DUF1795 domain-containing protein [Acidovorax sp. NCPPB 4044]
MLYHFNEGRIEAPDHVSDRTMHLLAPTPGTGEMTVAISKDELEADETPPEFLKRQLADLSRQVAKFTRGELLPAQLGAPEQKIGGSKFTVSYKQQGRTVHHVQSLFLLPDSHTVLNLTFSLPVPFTEEHHRKVDAVLASFVLRGKDGAI